LKISNIQNFFAQRQRDDLRDAGALYQRYQPGIYRYLYYRTGNSQTAEDFTADVFLKMVEVQAARPIDPARIQAWLFQVARNLAIDHYRRTAAHPHVELVEELEDRGPDVLSILEYNLTSEALAKALAQLEDTQRDVIVLRFFVALPIAETARVVHKSEDAIKALQRRGLIALRRYLELEEIKNGSIG
jgi:RNA polymerase sigma-70 factor, ECF subfamily